MMRYLLLGLGGIGLVGASFLAGLYLSFPADDARDRLTYEFDKANENDFALEIGDLSLWRLTGVSLEDVTIYSLKRGRRTKDDPKPPSEATPFIALKEAAVRVQILPLLVGQRAVAFTTDLFGGTIDGTFSTSNALTTLTMAARSLDLTQVPVSSGETTLNLTGSLTIDADLSFNTQELNESKGSLHLGFTGFGLGEGSKAAGFGLPVVAFDKAEVNFEVKDGKMEVTVGTFESPQLTATLSGDISLNKKLSRSRNRLELAFSLPADLDALAKLAPDLKRARDEEGAYHAMINGTLLAPTFRLSRNKTASAGVGKSELGLPGIGPGRNMDGPSEGGTMPAGSEEERQKAREQRIAERRERLKKRREEMDAQRPKSDGNVPDFAPGDFPTPEELAQQHPPVEPLNPEEMPPPDELPPFEDPPPDE